MEAAVLYCVHKYEHVYIYMCSVWVEVISSNFRCLVCCSVDLLLSQWEQRSACRGYLLAASFSSMSCLNFPYKQFRADNFWLKLGEMNCTQLHVHACLVRTKCCCFLLYIRPNHILRAGVKIVVSALRQAAVGRWIDPWHRNLEEGLAG